MSKPYNKWNKLFKKCPNCGKHIKNRQKVKIMNGKRHHQKCIDKIVEDYKKRKYQI